MGMLGAIVLASIFAAAASVKAENLGTTNLDRLQNFRVAAEKLPRPVTVLSFGDSMADSYQSISYVLMTHLTARLGTSGYALVNYQNSTMWTLSNGAQFVGPDSFWFTTHAQLPPGGVIWWEKQGSPGGVWCDHVGVFFVAQSNGGPFTLSVSTNNGPWTSRLTLNGYAGTPVGQFTNVALNSNYYRLRLDGQSGTNIILGPQLVNNGSTGVNVAFIYEPGLALDQVTNVPLAIRIPVLRALSPDLLIWHMKEDSSPATGQRLIECEQWWSNSVPGCDVVYIGTPYISIDTNSTWTTDQNRLVRSTALSYSRAYMDCMTPSVSYNWLQTNGYMIDATHENLLGNRYLEGFAWNSLGFFALATPRTLTIQPFQNAVGLGYLTSTGISYTVESSTDLRTWQGLSTNTGDGSPVIAVLPATEPHKLYRLRLRPSP